MECSRAPGDTDMQAHRWRPTKDCREECQAHPVSDFLCQPCALLTDWPPHLFRWTAQVGLPAIAQSTWTSLEQTWTLQKAYAWRLWCGREDMAKSLLACWMHRMPACRSQVSQPYCMSYKTLMASLTLLT